MAGETSMCLFVTVVGLITQSSTVSGQSITITGTNSLVTPTSELKITCTPSTAGVNDINSISIQKNTSTADYTNIVSVSFDKSISSSVLTWGRSSIQNRAGVSATGNVDTVSAARLEFIIASNYTGCQDEGAYKCGMGVTLSGGSPGLASAEKYVTASADPTFTDSITVTPAVGVDGQLYVYSVGTSIMLTCNGTVGIDRKTHQWCYRRASDDEYKVYPDASHIQQNEDSLISGRCNFWRTSTLTYTVTSSDTSTIFTCEPYAGGLCDTSASDLKTNITIRKVPPHLNAPERIPQHPPQTNLYSTWIVGIVWAGEKHFL